MKHHDALYSQRQACSWSLLRFCLISYSAARLAISAARRPAMARLCSRNFWRLWFATRSGFNRLAHSQRALKIHRETSNWVADSTFTFKPLNSFWTCSLSCLHSARGRQAAALRARALGVSLSLSLSRAWRLVKASGHHAHPKWLRTGSLYLSLSLSQTADRSLRRKLT